MKNQVTNLLNVSEIEVIYKTKIDKKDRKKITSSKDAYNLLKQVYNSDTVEYIESFYILILNSVNEAIGVKQISQGGSFWNRCRPQGDISNRIKSQCIRNNIKPQPPQRQHDAFKCRYKFD